MRPFGRLRRTRNDADYPRLDTPELTGEDITEDLPKARDIVTAMHRLIPTSSPGDRSAFAMAVTGADFGVLSYRT